MVNLPAGDRDPGHGLGAAGNQLYHADIEAAGGVARAGETAPPSPRGAARQCRAARRRSAGWCAGELTIEDQEREPAEMVAVQVGDEDDADLARVQPSGLERAKLM
jgi:hypothetical protein